jgi:hypothetical protein
MLDPPVAGSVKATDAAPLLNARLVPTLVPVGAAGVAGIVVAVIELVAAEAAPVADAFVPVTAKV